MKVSCSLLLLATVVCAMMVSSSNAAVLSIPAECSPNILEEVPPRIRKLCIALLASLYELRTGKDVYLDEKVPVVRENMPLVDQPVKRQDVEHVFLRFGRR